ncbi:MAG: hypothetical protein MJ113_03635 [Lachnospiraceae bacterium]|nr:hypothetical protein [Lachnospiraceae bacterium]
MNKLFKKMVCLLVVLSMVLVIAPANISKASSYTYNYDWWNEVRECPDAYTTSGAFTAYEMGLDKNLSKPEGLYVYEDLIYICDTGNNRIIELKRESQDKVSLLRTFDSITGSEVSELKGPTDIWRSADGYLYIADKGNGRVVKVDAKTLAFQMECTKPNDETYDQGWNFAPSKIVVDRAGRVYIVADSVNKGLCKFESDGTFSGFIGATPVVYNAWDYFWKRFSSREQRAASENFVPTVYDNVCMDKEGFMYVATYHIEEGALDSGSEDPIRKLNLLGNDILVRNGNQEIIGDLYWGDGGGSKGSSKFTDVTVLDNDVYFGLDKERGRIFAYDDQGNLLYVFGGKENLNGCFRKPVAIDHQGRDLIVLDGLDCSITILTPTHFGNCIYDAIEYFDSGLYDESAEAWREVMDVNGNFDLAYIGLGRALMRQERYKEAMEYFELKWNDYNYSLAYEQYRKIWIRENIGWVIAVLVIVFGVPSIYNSIKRKKLLVESSGVLNELEEHNTK